MRQPNLETPPPIPEYFESPKRDYEALGQGLVDTEDEYVDDVMDHDYLVRMRDYSQKLIEQGTSDSETPDALKLHYEKLDAAGPTQFVTDMELVLPLFAHEAATSERQREKVLAATRKVLRTIAKKDAEAHVIEQYFNGLAEAVPLLFRGAKDSAQANAETNSWLRWLSDETSDEQLINFFQWHTATVDKLQTSEAFKVRIERSKQEYGGKVRQGMQDGWIHGSAEANLPALEEQNFFAADVFDMVVTGAEAYRMAAGIVLPEEYTATLFDHEANHEVFQNTDRLWLFDEALAEHVARVMNGRNIESLTRYSWDEHGGFVWESEGGYGEDLKTLDALRRVGKSTIPAAVLTRALTASSHMSREKACAELMEYSRQAHGNPTLFFEIDAVARRYMNEQLAANQNADDAHDTVIDAVLSTVEGYADSPNSYDFIDRLQAHLNMVDARRFAGSVA